LSREWHQSIADRDRAIACIDFSSFYNPDVFRHGLQLQTYGCDSSFLVGDAIAVPSAAIREFLLRQSSVLGRVAIGDAAKIPHGSEQSGLLPISG
jgi:hypothetical protein